MPSRLGIPGHHCPSAKQGHQSKGLYLPYLVYKRVKLRVAGPRRLREQIWLVGRGERGPYLKSQELTVRAEGSRRRNKLMHYESLPLGGGGGIAATPHTQPKTDKPETEA